MMVFALAISKRELALPSLLLHRERLLHSPCQRNLPLPRGAGKKQWAKVLRGGTHPVWRHPSCSPSTVATRSQQLSNLAWLHMGDINPCTGR